MSRHVTRRLASMGLALAAASVALLVAAGTALARGPFPLHIVQDHLLSVGPAFPVVVLPIAIAIAIAVIALVARRQSVAARVAGHDAPVSLSASRESAASDDVGKRAA